MGGYESVIPIKYSIYGLDKNGKIILDHGVSLILSNN